MTTRSRSDAGFSLLEVMIATAIMLTVTGTVFTILNPAQGMFQAAEAAPRPVLGGQVAHEG